MKLMVFDAFCIQPSILPAHVRSAYRNRHPSITIFSNDPEISENIFFSDGNLSVDGYDFSYLFMKAISNDDLSPCEIIWHQIPTCLWQAQITAFKSAYRNFIDKEDVINEMKGLPFRSDQAKIDFFVNEMVFSPENGVIPLGLALMDSALQSTIALCKTRCLADGIPIRS